VTLDVKGLERVISNGKGGERMGLSATGKVSRKEFGISWVEPVLVGGVNVADEVVMEIEAELIRSVTPAAN
jgi:polyisoprenoid-binding protein YceI